jgi:hypothetical protein
MAIVIEQPSCDHADDQFRPVAGFLAWSKYDEAPTDERYRPACDECLRNTEHQVGWWIIYLDPSRQRRPPAAELGDAGDPDGS